MTDRPWSVLPDKLTLVGADQFALLDSEIPLGPLSNKLSTLTAITASFSAPKLLRAFSQADLEAEFGTDIIIPDGEFWTVLIMNDFTFTKSFQIGNGSVLELKEASTDLTIFCTGTGPVFKNVNPANPILSLIIDSMTIDGDNTRDIFDIVASFSVRSNSTLYNNFDNAGVIEPLFLDFDFAALQGVKTGLIVKNPSVANFARFSLNQSTSSPPVTFVTIQTNIASQVGFIGGFSSDDAADMLFLDPNAAAGSIFNVEDSTGAFVDIFAQGTDIAINSVADNGSGDTEFTAASAHGLEVGQAVVLSGFAIETTYNQTAIVTAISGLTFDCAITFTATDTGNMNAASLDQTDPLVLARNNVSTQDSMTISESRTNGVLEVDGSGGVDVPIVDVTPVSGDWIEDLTTERFSVNPTTGLVTYNGTIAITAMIKYSVTAEATSGGAQTINFDLHINSVEQAKTQITIVSATPPSSGVYNGGNFLINPGDTFQLFKNNTTNNNNTDVTATLLINLD